MFSVIEFEDGLQLVPSSWVDEESNTCFWPPVYFNQIKLNKMVAGQISPEQSWTQLKVLKHFGKSDSYKRGIEKLKLCMAQSDIDTAPSEEEKARRKVMRKRVINQSDSEDETSGILPLYPKVPKKKQIPLSKNKENLDLNDDRIESNKEHPKKRLCEGDSSNKYDRIELNQEHTNKRLCERDSLNKSSEKQFQELVLGKLNFLINRISSLEEKVELLRNVNIDNAQGSPELMKKFPLKDLSELKEIEKFISVEENYETLVHSLKGIGGCNDQNVIRNILKRVFSNEVAEKFSWLGAKEKSSLKQLQITKAILETARLHCPSITEEGYGHVVANWLRHAKQRSQREKGLSGKSPSGQFSEK